MSWISALWFYMTPQWQKPSAHEVITGLFKPNEKDSRTFNAGNNFGTTIALLAQDTEPLEPTLVCNTISSSSESDDRA